MMSKRMCMMYSAVTVAVLKSLMMTGPAAVVKCNNCLMQLMSLVIICLTTVGVGRNYCVTVCCHIM